MPTLSDEYDSVLNDLMGVVNVCIVGKQGAPAAAKRLLCEGTETLAGRLHHLRDRVALASRAEETLLTANAPKLDPTVFIKCRRKVG